MSEYNTAFERWKASTIVLYEAAMKVDADEAITFLQVVNDAGCDLARETFRRQCLGEGKG